MRLLPTIAALINAVVILAEPCRAQMPGNFASVPQRELVVGTKQTPPFAMKNADDSWSGISIDLWRHVADEQHLRYRFAEEPTVQALIDGVTAGRFDIAVAALTVTAACAQTLDFTQPFYVTGLGIAVPAGGEPSWLPIIHTLTSFGFAQAIIALVSLALAVGILVWVFERRPPGQRDATMVPVSYRDGLRASELADLRWGHLSPRLMDSSASPLARL